MTSQSLGFTVFPNSIFKMVNEEEASGSQFVSLVNEVASKNHSGKMEVRFAKKRGVANDLKLQDSPWGPTLNSRPPIIPSEASYSEQLS